MSRLASLRPFNTAVSCASHRIRGLARRIVSHVTRWRRLANERRLLGSMDDRMLRDIGITRVEAERESRKPFWR